MVVRTVRPETKAVFGTASLCGGCGALSYLMSLVVGGGFGQLMYLAALVFLVAAIFLYGKIATTDKENL